jgi:hypothetical protein
MPRGRIKPSSLVVGSLTRMNKSLSPRNNIHPPDPNHQAIVKTLNDYTSAWFRGDSAAMEVCLHPDVTARLLQLASESEQVGGIRILPRTQGIQATLGACTHPMERRREIAILDASAHSASARVILGDWAAYVHLSYTRDRWAIVNVLWEWLSPGDRRSA